MANINRRLLPSIGALAIALLTAAILLSLSRAALESFAWNTGVAGMIPAAAPPLGSAARFLLAAGVALFAGAVAWSVLFLLWGPGGFLVARGRSAGDMVSVRRADAHPDAPPRRPISAESDFGAPPPDIPPAVERPLPADLDQPLAAFDARAIPSVPQSPAQAVRALATLSARAPAPVDPAPSATIESLLLRLEAGAERRAARTAE